VPFKAGGHSTACRVSSFTGLPVGRLVAHRDLSAEEQRAYDRLSSLYTKGIGSRPP